MDPECQHCSVKQVESSRPRSRRAEGPAGWEGRAREGSRRGAEASRCCGVLRGGLSSASLKATANPRLTTKTQALESTGPRPARSQRATRGFSLVAEKVPHSDHMESQTCSGSASVETMPASRRALLELRPWTKPRTPTMPREAGSGSRRTGESPCSADPRAGRPCESQTTRPWCCWWFGIVTTLFPRHGTRHNHWNRCSPGCPAGRRPSLSRV